MSTMPRAPMCSASMICWVVMVEVSSRILTVGEPFMMARMASRPGRRGIWTSSSRMSGGLLEGLGDGLVAVVGFADDFKAVVLGEHVAHADADDRMIVCQYDANGLLFHESPIPPKSRN